MDAFTKAIALMREAIEVLGPVADSSDVSYWDKRAAWGVVNSLTGSIAYLQSPARRAMERAEGNNEGHS